MEDINMGTHVLGKVVGCNPDFLRALNIEDIKGKVSQIIKDCNLTELKDPKYHPFPNDSFTALVGLAESHAAFHTWPELGVVTIDVYTCNYSRDNSEGARKAFDEIAKLFGKGKVIKREIER